MAFSHSDVRSPDGFKHYVGVLAEADGGRNRATVYQTALELLLDGMKDSWGGADSVQVPSFSAVAAKLDEVLEHKWGT